MRHLLCCLNPRGTFRHVVVVRKKCKAGIRIGLDAHQVLSRLQYGKLILRSLRQHAHKSELRNRAGSQIWWPLLGHAAQPACSSTVEFMVETARETNTLTSSGNLMESRTGFPAPAYASTLRRPNRCQHRPSAHRVFDDPRVFPISAFFRPASPITTLLLYIRTGSFFFFLC
jgi:hypothetical protein